MVTLPDRVRKRPSLIDEAPLSIVSATFPSRQEAVAAALRSAILRGELEAGARLDIDVIAARHGVSRTPVRDALKQLQAEGLVQVLAYRGVVVTRLTADDLRELFAIRIALEQLAVMQAAHAITTAELDALRLMLRRMDRAKSRDAAWAAQNTAFHDAIHAATGWPRLIANIRIQRVNVERYVRACARELGTERQQREHHALVEALAQRDADAAAALIASHLEQTMRTLAGLVASDGESASFSDVAKGKRGG